MKLLLVADQVDNLQTLQLHLRLEAFQCDSAQDKQSATRKLIDYDYDVVVLALDTGSEESLKMVKWMRSNQSQAAILILIASTDPEQRIKVLASGADDCLSKPWHAGELVARIKSVLRRQSGNYLPVMRLNSITIKPGERRVWIEEAEILLTRKEYEILLYLIRHKNRVVTKENLAEYLWSNFEESAGNYDFIYTHVKNLRKKLQEAGAGNMLRTVYGVGYKINPEDA